MRELKFRVWSEEDKEYRTDLNVFRLHDGKVICTSPAYSLEGDRFDVEQYTGLKDKNGKEVYEGDIVEADSRIYEVDWLEKDGGWFCFTKDDYYTPLYHVECAVIGNVHENPELLEEGK